MEPTTDRDPLLLPEGARLLHIGPPKTGTSSIQGAFHSARLQTDAQGVHYAGRARHSASAVLAMIGRSSAFAKDRPPSLMRWRLLVRDIRAARGRVVISSEFFADAQRDTIEAIVRDLDPARVHVVVTLRPLAAILPSQWQQYVQGGLRVAYVDWLEAMLGDGTSRVTPGFWHRHRHDRLVARWTDVVGQDRVTVLVPGEGDRGAALRAFERLTGLREGTLIPDQDVANRSMTLPEIEAVRAFNVAFRARGLGRPLLSRVMHFGAGQYMKRRPPDPAWPAIATPAWALGQADGIAREIMAGIDALNVGVIGDLAALAPPVPPAAEPNAQTALVAIPPRVAGTMAVGVLLASGAARGIPVAGRPEVPTRIPTYLLAVVVGGRVRDAVRSVWRAVRHARRPRRVPWPRGQTAPRGRVS